ncbi:MAG: CRISPR-associated endonuclease Cas2 [Actinobacteria bacterium]|nr:CRISPR-associated endonuclease Cas2 [Actinomycetota bacterium]
MRCPPTPRSPPADAVARRRYLVAYDIRHPTRLRQVFKAMKGYGEHLQYSVFLCDLDGVEKPAMLLHLGSIISHGEDSVAIVDLGEAREWGSLCFEFMGTHRPLPGGSSLVV